MEPSPGLASEVEFNGSESGWTTYIGSPIYNDDEQSVDMEEYGNNYKNGHGNIDDNNDDDDDDDDHNKGEKNDDRNKESDDEESDDSMASDASSGPSHVHLVCIKSEGSHGSDFTEHGENDREKILSAKRATKQVRKTRYEGTVENEEQDSLLVADSAESHV
ncbi:protein SOB FIVE-LIKE 1-like [Gastrolobium bilobum]|uniref:protein SOB FIVE-LIKE 1-like n=1 Tax=Gastrolobium bilobum TaxID=150636 RepID=UPI002AB1E517|nr:protein SOB FIVE-LIKE 1-like [Gastrolobium bilobum]